MSKNMFGCMQLAVGNLTIYHPFFIEFLYSMKYVEATELLGKIIPAAATDGITLYVNPEFATKCSLDEQVFVLLHELSHKMLGHVVRRNGRDNTRWNIACDYAANLMLQDYNITLLKGVYCDEKYRGMSVEQIYEKLPQNIHGSGSGDGRMQGDVLDYKGDPLAFDTEIKQIMAKAVAVAHMEAGEIPGAFKSLIKSALEDKPERWYDKLHRYMQSQTMSQYAWNRINHRVLRTHGTIAPGMFSECLNRLAVFIDTSGSCFDQATQAQFCGHLNAILAEAKPRTVVVYYFDVGINSMEEFQNGETDITLHSIGGGGTDFRHLFDDLEEIPDVAIVLTDLEGPVGQAPDFPVLWAITSKEEAPFGDSVYVE